MVRSGQCGSPRGVCIFDQIGSSLPRQRAAADEPSEAEAEAARPCAITFEIVRIMSPETRLSETWVCIDRVCEARAFAVGVNTIMGGNCDDILEMDVAPSTVDTVEVAGLVLEKDPDRPGSWRPRRAA